VLTPTEIVMAPDTRSRSPGLCSVELWAHRVTPRCPILKKFSIRHQKSGIIQVMPNVPPFARRVLKLTVGLAAAGILIVWLIDLSRQQSPLRVVEHRLLQKDGGWHVEATLANQGEASAKGVFQVHYYPRESREMRTATFSITPPAPGEQRTVTVGPLAHIDPARRDRYTLYVGTAGDPYGPSM